MTNQDTSNKEVILHMPRRTIEHGLEEAAFRFHSNSTDSFKLGFTDASILTLTYAPSAGLYMHMPSLFPNFSAYFPLSQNNSGRMNAAIEHLPKPRSALPLEYSATRAEIAKRLYGQEIDKVMIQQDSNKETDKIILETDRGTVEFYCTLGGLVRATLERPGKKVLKLDVREKTLRNLYPEKKIDPYKVPSDSDPERLIFRFENFNDYFTLIPSEQRH